MAGHRIPKGERRFVRMQEQINILLDGGNLAEAEQVSKEMIDRHPANPVAWLYRESVLAVIPNQKEEANRALERAYACDSDHPNVLLAVASDRFRNGRMEEALTLIRRAVEIAPDWAPAHRQMACILGDGLGRTGEAAEALAAFLADHPEEAWLREYLARFRRAKGAVP